VKVEISLSWHEVLERHGSRRGIRVTPTQASLLLDFGLSAYVNQRQDGRIRYEGEGKRGDQQPMGGNAGLFECLETGRTLTVFERVKPGIWFDRGPHRVTEAHHVWRESEQRYVFEFVLEKARRT
jgi:hypothetical protein